MKCESAVFGSGSKPIGNKDKSNM